MSQILCKYSKNIGTMVTRYWSDEIMKWDYPYVFADILFCLATRTTKLSDTKICGTNCKTVKKLMCKNKILAIIKFWLPMWADGFHSLVVKHFISMWIWKFYCIPPIAMNPWHMYVYKFCMYKVFIFYLFKLHVNKCKIIIMNFVIHKYH